MTPIRTVVRAGAATVAHCVRPVSPRPVWQTPYSTDKVRKMRSFWSLSLQRQLTIAIGLLLAPVLAAAIWSGMSTVRERASELGDQTRIIAYTTAAYISRDLMYLDGTGENLRTNPDIRTLNPELSKDLFRRITAGHSMIACINLVH